MTERMRVEVDDRELQALIPLLDELMLKKTELLDIELPAGLGDVAGAAVVVERETEAIIIHLKAGLDDVQAEAEFTEAYIEAMIDKVTIEMLAVEAQAKSLKDAFIDLDLPTVDRATRMVLLRIPGLREALRLLYQISMFQRTLAIPGRGGIIAAIVALLYLQMSLAQMERRQKRMEDRMRYLERRGELRMLNIEQALEGYGNLPERYRVTILPS